MSPWSWALVGFVALFTLLFFWRRRSGVGRALSQSVFSQERFAKRRARRTTLLRLLAVSSLVAALTIGFISERTRKIPSTSETPCVSSGIIVVDMSGSTDFLAQEIGKKLTELTVSAGPNRRAGLVFFSDQAYPLWYPCAKSENFRKLIRGAFTHRRTKEVRQCSPWGCSNTPLSVHPWMKFVSGTQISFGLRAALQQYRAYPHVRRAPVVLISDLENGEGEGILESVLDDYDRLGIPLRIFELPRLAQGGPPFGGGPMGGGENTSVYRSHVRNVSFTVNRRTLPPSPKRETQLRVDSSYSVPTPSILLGAIALFALFVNEFVLPLRIPRRSLRPERRKR